MNKIGKKKKNDKNIVANKIQELLTSSNVDNQLLKLSRNIDHISEIQESIKIKGNDIVEIEGTDYYLSKEAKDHLKKRVAEENIVNDMMNALKPYNGRKCNILISNGSVCDYFKNIRFRYIDSTQWRIFYTTIYDDLNSMKDYDKISQNLYATVINGKICYEMGKLRFLKEMEEIDICFLSEEIKIPNSQKLVESKDFITSITSSFIEKYVKEIYIVTKENKIQSSGFKYKVIDYKKPSKPSIFQVVINKISGN
ncbi:hypothetical protein NUSPORA_00583 [Nucleospora cyclopteri]